MAVLLQQVVYIFLGRLKGIAHAGANGNTQAVIAASWLEATHLMIADKLESDDG